MNTINLDKSSLNTSNLNINDTRVTQLEYEVKRNQIILKHIIMLMPVLALTLFVSCQKMSGYEDSKVLCRYVALKCDIHNNCINAHYINEYTGEITPVNKCIYTVSEQNAQ